MEYKNETPSKSKTNLMNKVLTSSLNCDSPFRLLPNISTPPSRFTKILNPFESHLIERLHLPTFSPGVFAQISTPKNEEKFKWTIDEISSLKPADIDEATISQHVIEHDPTVESLVQEKIEKFFNEKAIAPSPYTAEIKRMPMIASPVSPPKVSNSSTQTVLTLPPILPKHVEDVLTPYFTYNNPQQKDILEDNDNSSLYRKLFDFEESVHESVQSSPALSTGLSPIQFSPPEFNLGSPKRTFDSPIDMPELRDCTLSPIGRSPEGRSACRLSFSGHMSLDASLVVPDVNRSINVSNVTNIDLSHQYQNEQENLSSDSSNNWDMEYKQVSILSRSPEDCPEMIDSSNSNTPHSKIFTSQRKRLSESFKDEESKDVEMEEPEHVPRRIKSRLVVDDVTDAGYITGGVTMCESSLHMFASTPSKHKN